MDTDDLSPAAYNGIIVEAEKFDHNLTLQFGLLSYSCENEKEYLSKAKNLIKRIKRLDNYSLTDMFFDNPPDKNKLHLTLDQISANILEVEKNYNQQI
jgi:hypothetical protein